MSGQNIKSSLYYLADSIRTAVSRYESSVPASTATEEAVYDLITESRYGNPWFIPEHMQHALLRLSHEIEYAAAKLQSTDKTGSRNIGVLFRNEAPAEGIAELIFLAASGCTLQVISAKELKLYLDKVRTLLGAVPLIHDNIHFDADNNGRFGNSDAIIAFSEINDTLAGYLQRFRVLQLHSGGESLVMEGNETEDQLARVAGLVCMYFGRSSKNIRVLYIPEGFKPESLSAHFNNYSDQLFHNKYFNNFEYRKASMLINKIPHEVMGPVIVTEDTGLAGYTSVLCIRKYRKASDITGSELLQRFPLSDANTEEMGNDLLRLSTIRDSIENISRFILQD